MDKVIYVNHKLKKICVSNTTFSIGRNYPTTLLLSN